MVNINCPTAIYKTLSYIFLLPSREPFDMSNFMDKLQKTSSSGPFYNPKCLLVSQEKYVISHCVFASLLNILTTVKDSYGLKRI